MLKNITLSAEEELINKARQKAQRERTTLNTTFRHWLTLYVNTGLNGTGYDSMMNSLSYARPGKRFSRDEMNER